jgi:hypothetical protein
MSKHGPTSDVAPRTVLACASDVLELACGVTSQLLLKQPDARRASYWCCCLTHSCTMMCIAVGATGSSGAARRERSSLSSRMHLYDSDRMSKSCTVCAVCWVFPQRFWVRCGVLNSINNDAISQPWFTISQLPTVTGTSRNYPHHVPASAYYPRRSLIIPMTYSMAYGRAMCTLTPVCTMNVGWCCCRNKGQRKESTCRSSCLLILPPKMKRRGGGAHSASSSRASRIGRR